MMRDFRHGPSDRVRKTASPAYPQTKTAPRPPEAIAEYGPGRSSYRSFTADNSMQEHHRIHDVKIPSSDACRLKVYGFNE